MASLRDTLVYMGFAPERVDWALDATNHTSIDHAIDHIEANIIKPVPNLANVTSTDMPLVQGEQEHKHTNSWTFARTD